MAKDEAKIKFRADTSEFSESLSKAKDAARELTSQMNLLEAQFGNAGDKGEYLKNKQKLLQEQLATNAEKVTALNGKLESAVKIYGENSHEAQYWATELNKAKTAQENLKSQLSKVNSEIEENTKKEKNAKTATSDLTSTINKQEKELAELKQEYVEAVLQYGKNSTEAKELATQIKVLSTKLDDNEKELKEATEQADKFDQSLKNSGESAKSVANGGYTVLKNIVANAITSAFQAATQYVKEFATSVIETGKEFYSSMSNVEALSGATAEEMEALTAKAQEMGATTAYTASEAADAMGYMALAGWDAEEMIDGIAPILNLAASNQMDLATASDIVTDDLTAFGLAASDAAHFSDVLATTSANSNTDVTQMGEAFKYAGAVCGTMGYSIEDAALALGTMANSGIKGSMAGTALRSVITRLATGLNEEGEAINALAVLTENLGVEFYDSAGQARDLSDVLEEARVSWAGLTAAEKAEYANQISGKYALAGFLSLMSGEAITTEEVSAAVEELGYSFEDMGTSVTELQAIYVGYNDITETATALVEQFGMEQEDANQIAAMLASTMNGQTASLKDVTAAVKECGINWDDYTDRVWMSNDAVENLVDEAMYNLERGLFETEEGIQEYVEFLASEYDMSIEDAQTFTDAFLESAGTTTTAWDDLKDAIENCDGSAQEMADTMLNNLKGDMTIMDSALDGLKLQIFDCVNEPLRNLVQTITNDVIPAASNAVTWISQNGDVISDVATVLGIATVGFIAYNAAMGIKTAMDAAGATSLLGYASAQVAANTAFLACPLTWIIAGITALIAVIVLCVKHWDDIKEAVGNFGAKIGEVFSNFGSWCSENIGQPIAESVANVKQDWRDLKESTKANLYELGKDMSEKWSGIRDDMKDKLEQAKNYTSEKLSNIKSAYEEHGGGIKGIAAATMEAIKSKYQAGFDVINTLTGGKLGTLADTMRNKMDEAKQRVHDAIESIKSFFNFNISWPHISMPSISVSWSTDGTLAKAAQFLGLPGLPSFSINWNALGAIFDDPTLIGWAGGKLQGVGEAGPEAVTPIDTLRQYIGDAIDERLTASERNASGFDWLKEKLDMIEERIEASGNIFLDGDKVSNKIAPYSDSVSGVRNELADRGVLV